MPRFFKEFFEDDPVITGADASHITKSLRMTVGEKLTVCDTHGKDFECEICSVSDEKTVLKILNCKKTESEPNVAVTLYVCLPKGDKMDLIIKQAVELGVSEIVPVISGRCIARPDEKSAAKKVERFNKIAAEAAGQSGRGILPKVKPFLTMRQCAAELKNYDKSLFFYELGGVPMTASGINGAKKIAVITGSEGGFDTDEAKLLCESGAVAVTLGKRILRAETAPAAALTAIMLISGNLE